MGWRYKIRKYKKKYKKENNYPGCYIKKGWIDNSKEWLVINMAQVG